MLRKTRSRSAPGSEPEPKRLRHSTTSEGSSSSSSHPPDLDDNSKPNSGPRTAAGRLAVGRNTANKLLNCSAALMDGVVVFPQPPMTFPSVCHLPNLLQEREQVKSSLEKITNNILVLNTSYKLQQVEKSSRMEKYAEINRNWGQLDEDIKISKLRFCVPEQSAAFLSKTPPEPLRWQEVSAWEQGRIENYLEDRINVSLSLVLCLFKEFTDVKCILRNLEITEPKDFQEQIKLFVQLMIKKLEVKNKNLRRLQSNLEDSVERLKGLLPEELVVEDTEAITTEAKTTDAIPAEAIPTEAIPAVAIPTEAIPAEAIPIEAILTEEEKGIIKKIEYQQADVDFKRALRLQLLEYQSLWVRTCKSFQNTAHTNQKSMSDSENHTSDKKLNELQEQNQILQEKSTALEERLKTAFLDVTTADVKFMQSSLKEELIKSSVQGSQAFSSLDNNYQNMLRDMEYVLSKVGLCLENKRRVEISRWNGLRGLYNNPDPHLWNAWSARFTQLRADILGTKRQYQKVWLENEEAKIGTLKRQSQITSFKLQLNVFEQVQNIRHSMKKRFTTFAMLASNQHQALLTENKVVNQKVQFLEKISQRDLQLVSEQQTNSTLINEVPGSVLQENEILQKRIAQEKDTTSKMRDEIMAYKALNREQRSNHEIEESVIEYQRKIKEMKEQLCATVKAELTDEAKEVKKFEELTDAFKKLTSTFQDNDNKINAITDDFNAVSEALEKLDDQVPNVKFLLNVNEKDTLELLRDHAKVSGKVIQDKEAIAVQQNKIVTSCHQDNCGISAQVPTFLEKLEELSNTSLKLNLDLIEVNRECRLNIMEETVLKLKLKSSESSLSSVRSIHNHLKDKLQQEGRTSENYKSQVEYLKSEVKFIEDLQTGGKGRWDALSKELDELKASLTCHSCKSEKKNAYLGKCFHVSCKDCLNKCNEVRSRKCPICGSSFAKQDIKPLYIV